ncbi:MFS transporter [Nocardiopsis sp. FIRDI 009]|uniref:MFS transporter n=1 Tax=Nocardiopsis sp. FIRDI 009 TaxID=714197 RepID=UPI000E2368AC|nr:MFS transporter [Nocardiopsis sp. FIRDI 009]
MTDGTPLRTDTPPSPDAAPRPAGARFGFLLTSSGLSNLADGVLKVGLPLAALTYTDSPTLVAGVTLALGLPWLLLALPAGALADRADRRAAMLGANVARAALLGLLAVLLVLDTGSIGALYALAFCVGAAETVYDTAAQSILPQVVARERLSRANGRLHAVELTANQFVGPPLGGLLVALGAAVAFAAPAALWLVAVGALLLVRGRFRVERPTRTTVRADVAEGLRFLWRHRLLRTFAVLVGVSNLATSASFAAFVLFAVGPDSPMGLSEPGYGLLLTATAAGSLVGALAADRVERLLGRVWALRLSVLGFGALVGVPALTAAPFPVGAGFLVGGVSIAVWNVVTVSLRQRVTPDTLLGRVNSAYRLVAWGTMPLGAALGGLLGEFLGLRAVFALMALVIVTPLAALARLDEAALSDTRTVNG